MGYLLGVMDGLIAALQPGSVEGTEVSKLRESMKGELGVEGMLGEGGGVQEDEGERLKGWKVIGKWGTVVESLMRKYGVQRGIGEEEVRRD